MGENGEQGGGNSDEIIQIPQGVKAEIVQIPQGVKALSRLLLKRGTPQLR